MAKQYYHQGQWKAVCAVCGFEFYSSQLKERWDGVQVCKEDWEPRHILDFFQIGRSEKGSVPWSQPADHQGEVTITTIQITPQGISPSLTDVTYNFVTSGPFRTVVLPNANDTGFFGNSLIYNLSCDLTSANNVSVTGSGSQLLGGTVTMTPGTSAKFQNYPASNMWQRVA